ncbi:MAG: hypothetical protein AAFQ57_11455 [Cyanobacteria bacterium J06626_14]
MTPLSNLTNLTKLYLSYNQISEVGERGHVHDLIVKKVKPGQIDEVG